MIDFTYYNPAKILFGRDSEQKLVQELAAYGNRVLLIYGGGSILQNGVYDKVTGLLQQSGIEFTELGGVKPNPKLSLVREGIRLCREKDIQAVLAVGGGSVIDTAKAVAAGVPYDGDVWDFFAKKAAPSAALPIAAVLTIAAAGSESSDSMVITNEELGLKRSFHSDWIIPKASALNPENTFSLSGYQTACGASDILAHLMERFFTQVRHTDLTDRLIEADFRTILNNAPWAIANGDDYNARAEVMWAGCIAHNNLLNTGRVGDWASHAMEHELSAETDLAHGAGLSIVFPAWMKYVYPENKDRFIQFAVRMFDVSVSAAEDIDGVILEGVSRLERFYQSIGLPTRLSEVGIGEDKIAALAKRCASDKPDKTVGHFKKLGEEDVYNIYRLAL